MKYKNSIQWIARATIVTLVTALVLSTLEPEPGHPGIPINWQLGIIMISVIVGLLVNEIYNAMQYRYFERLFGELISMETPPLFSYSMYRALTDSERDDVINRLVGLSDKNWDKFLEFSMEKHYFKFEEFDKSIIRDIEMVRALKD